MPELRRDVKYLQIAIDYTDLEKAVLLLKKIQEIPENVIIEVGTPLIKSNGVYRTIRAIREVIGENHLVLADMKTIDTGFLEAELVFASGGNITTVLGVSDNETIINALRASKMYKGLLQVDLINHPDPIQRAMELEKIGVHIIGLHAGIDTQKGKKLRAVDLVGYVCELKKNLGDKVFISIAGGIKPSETGFLASKGADIIVIGGSITNSPDPRLSLLEALRNLKH